MILITTVASAIERSSFITTTTTRIIPSCWLWNGGVGQRGCNNILTRSYNNNYNGYFYNHNSRGGNSAQRQLLAVAKVTTTATTTTTIVPQQHQHQQCRYTSSWNRGGGGGGKKENPRWSTTRQHQQQGQQHHHQDNTGSFRRRRRPDPDYRPMGTPITTTLSLSSEKKNNNNKKKGGGGKKNKKKKMTTTTTTSSSSSRKKNDITRWKDQRESNELKMIKKRLRQIERSNPPNDDRIRYETMGTTSGTIKTRKKKQRDDLEEDENVHIVPDYAESRLSMVDALASSEIDYHHKHEYFYEDYAPNDDGDDENLNDIFGPIQAEQIRKIRTRRIRDAKYRSKLQEHYDPIEEDMRLADLMTAATGSVEQLTHERHLFNTSMDFYNDEHRNDFMETMRQCRRDVENFEMDDMMDEATHYNYTPKPTDPEEIQARKDAKILQRHGVRTRVFRSDGGIYDDDDEDENTGDDDDDDDDEYTGDDADDEDANNPAYAFDPNALAHGEWSEYLVDTDRVTRLWKDGRIDSYRALVIGGNLNGCGGFGMGKANDPISAVNLAAKKCKRNIIFCRPYNGDGLTHDLVGKHNNVKVCIHSTDNGLRGNEMVCEILLRFGIVNAVCKSHGNRNNHNPYNVVRATFKALLGHENMETIALKRGKRLTSIDRAIRMRI